MKSCGIESAQLPSAAAASMCVANAGPRAAWGTPSPSHLQGATNFEHHKLNRTLVQQKHKESLENNIRERGGVSKSDKIR